MRLSFLVLQGTASPFFSRLALALRARGHAALRVNFCGGDLLYAGVGEAWNFRGRADELPAWYADTVRARQVTDILMFGDCREIHQRMHPVAEAHGLRVHVFEEGYLRPFWLTLERYGVNGRSRLPRDPAWYVEHATSAPTTHEARATGYNLVDRARHDICYRVANAACARRFPHYRSHRPANGLSEYAGLAMRALRGRRYRDQAAHVATELIGGKLPYYLFPLQLDSDAQIVAHSRFSGIGESIDVVMHSFARRARNDASLVIKNHPLDTGLVDHRKHASELAAQLGVDDRVFFIETGDLPLLLDHALGVVVVNSTVGMAALERGRPVLALGTAVYDMPGLTWQHGIDTFWMGAEPPDRDIYRAFVDYVACHTQINGDFYTRTGIGMAVAGAIKRLEAPGA